MYKKRYYSYRRREKSTMIDVIISRKIYYRSSAISSEKPGKRMIAGGRKCYENNMKKNESCFDELLLSLLSSTLADLLLPIFNSRTRADSDDHEIGIKWKRFRMKDITTVRGFPN